MKRIVLTSLGLWLVLVSVGACADQGKGKIAVATQGDTPAASVSSQAGFSPFFLLFDRDGTLVETMKNPVQTTGMGSGKTVVDALADKGVKVLVAEGFGSRIVEYMADKGMKQVEYKGNATAAVAKAKSALQSQ
jgi:predicted Fe-Mo cluster-binding NifX family protein